MKADIKHRMGRRCKEWDYGQRAIYMVTLTLAERGKPLLAGWPEKLRNIAVSGNAQNGTAYERRGDAQDGTRVPPRFCASPETARYRCPPTPLGEKTLACWQRIPEFWPTVSLFEAVVMPDHFHGILFVEEPLPAGKTLGDIIRGFKTGCKEVEWAAGFVDTIIFHDNQLKTMAAYIRDNPYRLAEKRANPALFQRVTSLSLPLGGGRFTGHFEAVGNRHLLERPLWQVQCSRRFFAWHRVPKPGGGVKIARDTAGAPVVERASAEYEERLEEALAAAAHGAVIVCPCISDGERQIALEIHRRKLPLVALRNMGFSQMEKPAGRLFEACSEGRLLLLAPAAWPHLTQKKPMTRLDATALNRICQWLVGEDAAEINYHGMKPVDIDRIALDAVQPTSGNRV